MSRVRGEGGMDSRSEIGEPTPEARMGVWRSGLLEGRRWLEGEGRVESGVLAPRQGEMMCRTCVRRRAGITSGRCSQPSLTRMG